MSSYRNAMCSSGGMSILVTCALADAVIPTRQKHYPTLREAWSLWRRTHQALTFPWGLSGMDNISPASMRLRYPL